MRKQRIIKTSRPVYIESCACVVKDAVKCSFECLSVVHHTCRIHSVGVGDGEIIKLPKNTSDQLLMVKETSCVNRDTVTARGDKKHA